jgi:hypothetical protein
VPAGHRREYGRRHTCFVSESEQGKGDFGAHGPGKYQKEVVAVSAFGTDYPLHIESRNCGLFVVGEGNCIPVSSMEQARRLIEQLKAEKNAAAKKP